MNHITLILTLVKEVAAMPLTHIITIGIFILLVMLIWRFDRIITAIRQKHKDN